MRRRVATPEVKIAYAPELRAVRCEFTAAQCRASESPPESLLERTRTKLENERKFGNVDIYAVLWDRFRRMWRKIQQDQSISGDTKFSINLGMGYPKLQGVTIKTCDSPQDPVIAKISIKASKEDLQSWRPEWLELAVQKELAIAPTKGIANTGSIHAAYHRALGGAEIIDWPIFRVGTASQPAATPYSIVFSSSKKELFLIIHDIQPFRHQSYIESMIENIRQSLKQSRSSKTNFRFLKNHILNRINEFLQGPQRVGLELPFAVLAAYEFEAVGLTPEPINPTGNVGTTAVQLTISDDRLQVSILEISDGVIKQLPSEKIIELVKSELKRLKIIHGISQQGFLRLKTALDRKLSPKSLILATGTTPIAPTIPEPVPAQDKKGNLIVAPGDLVATIVFKDPGKPGKDIFGHEIAQSGGDFPNITLGEGIVEKGKGQFYANAHGIVQVHSDNIVLQKQLVHHGDVTLASEKLTFHGPVRITGSIETGAAVSVIDGNLTVKGSVKSPFVFVKGDLIVEGGINTGSSAGTIRVIGNMEAKFVENSAIECTGNLTSTKAIINSQIACGGRITTLEPGSRIAGGKITSYGSILTYSIGFESQSQTKVLAGADWRNLNSVSNLTDRLKNIEIVLENTRLALREIVRKQSEQMTAKHLALKENYQRRIPRLKEISEKLKKRIATKNLSIKHNPLAIIRSSGVLFDTCQISIAGNAIPMPSSRLVGVIIHANRLRGSHFTDMNSELAKRLETNGSLADVDEDDDTPRTLPRSA